MTLIRSPVEFESPIRYLYVKYMLYDDYHDHEQIYKQSLFSEAAMYFDCCHVGKDIGETGERLRMSVAKICALWKDAESCCTDVVAPWRGFVALGMLDEKCNREDVIIQLRTLCWQMSQNPPENPARLRDIMLKMCDHY